MSWKVLFFACFMFSGSVSAQSTDSSEFEFRSNGDGQISKLPRDEIYPKIRIASFIPDQEVCFDPLSDSAFAVLDKMPNLEQLKIRCITDPLSERTARLISNRNKLKVLLIQNAVLSQDAIRVVLGIPLEVLSIETVPVADQLQFLNKEKLLNLSLNHCGLQNKNATSIADSPKLQYLDVQGNEYVNAGFISGLGVLKKLKALHFTDVELSMDNCRQVTKQFPRLHYLSAQSSIEGEAFLNSSLIDFALLQHNNGRSPLWGTEYD